MNSTTVIVGASLAGINAARTLRLQGHAGSIIVVDADSERPYDRPPLSKQMLTGEWEPEKILLPAGKEDLDLEFRLGVRAKAVDLGARQITLEGADGTVANTAFDSLVIASGASARRLPDSAGIAGVHVVRTLADSFALRAELEAGPSRVVVIGAGFIGAEVASSCRKRGIEVTLVEAMPLPLERILGAEMGRVCAQVHIENGVDLRLGTGVLQLETETVDGVEKVVGVALTDGTTVATEIVVVGIGVTLNVDWLEGSGLTLDDGVVTTRSSLLQASLPQVISPDTRALGLGACFASSIGKPLLPVVKPQPDGCWQRQEAKLQLFSIRSRGSGVINTTAKFSSLVVLCRRTLVSSSTEAPMSSASSRSTATVIVSPACSE